MKTDCGLVSFLEYTVIEPNTVAQTIQEHRNTLQTFLGAQYHTKSEANTPSWPLFGTAFEVACFVSLRLAIFRSAVVSSK